MIKRSFIRRIPDLQKIWERWRESVDLLILECSFFKDKPVETHLELSEAMYLIRYAKPKRVILTHLYPEWDTVDFQKEVEKFSPPCEIIEARDGLKLEI